MSYFIMISETEYCVCKYEIGMRVLTGHDLSFLVYPVFKKKKTLYI